MKVCWGSWRSCLKPKQSTCTRRWHYTRTLRCYLGCKWSLTCTGCWTAPPCWGRWLFSSKNKVGERCLCCSGCPAPCSPGVLESCGGNYTPECFSSDPKTCWFYGGISEILSLQKTFSFPTYWKVEVECKSPVFCLGCMLPQTAVGEHQVGWDICSPSSCLRGQIIQSLCKTDDAQVWKQKDIPPALLFGKPFEISQLY